MHQCLYRYKSKVIAYVTTARALRPYGWSAYTRERPVSPSADRSPAHVRVYAHARCACTLRACIHDDATPTSGGCGSRVIDQRGKRGKPRRGGREPIRQNRVFNREKPDSESMNEKWSRDNRGTSSHVETRHLIYSMDRDRSRRPTFATATAASLPSSRRRFMRKLHETLWVGFSAMRGFPRHRTFTPDCGRENVPLRADLAALPRRGAAAETYGDSSRRWYRWCEIAGAIFPVRSRGSVTSRIFKPRFAAQGSVAADLFEFCISRERGKDSNVIECLVIVFRSR